jgi:hypothetical protein
MPIGTRKSHPENGPEGQEQKRQDQAADDTTAEVQKLSDEETSKGYRGVEADPTPNENYTVAGVTSGAPTPETDKGAARQVRDYADEVQAKTEGVARNDG